MKNGYALANIAGLKYITNEINKLSIQEYEKLKSKIKIGINGFGRIGRNVFKIAHKRAIYDVQSLMVQGKTVKVLSWYDNEWGYSCRVVDLVDLFNL